MKKTSLIISLVLFLAACATVPVTNRSQLSFVPASQMVSLGLDSYKKIMSESKLSSDTRKVEMVRRVGERVARATEDFMRASGRERDIKNYLWEFNLIEDEQINAFAIPGGKVFIATGILPVTQDENGLAVVIGHEIAHVIANHSGERLSQFLLVQMGGLTLSQALKNNSEGTRQFAMIAYGAGATFGAILPYSRLHENEADRIGLILMAMAGYDPREAIPFWQRMEKAGGARMPEFLSTHPSSATRIRKIEEYLEEALIYYQP